MQGPEFHPQYHSPPKTKNFYKFHPRKTHHLGNSTLGECMWQDSTWSFKIMILSSCQWHWKLCELLPGKGGTRWERRYINGQYTQKKMLTITNQLEKCKLKPYWNTALQPFGWLLFKKRRHKEQVLPRMWHCWWKYKMVHLYTCRKQVISQKIKHWITIWSSNFTPTYRPRTIESRIPTYIWISKFTVVLVQ